MSAAVIALLGAESTGKTQLSTQLAKALHADGLHAVVVPEYLREWCDAQGRVPLRHEQEHIATMQTQRIRVAQQQAQIVLADTTAMMSAVYSEVLFGDGCLYPQAFAAQKTYALTLVTQLDVPWVADGFQRDGAHLRPIVDATLRTRLSTQGVNFQTVCGLGEQRARNALRWCALLLYTQRHQQGQ